MRRKRRNQSPEFKARVALAALQGDLTNVPRPVSEEELALMALIDRCHLKQPFYGGRRIRDWQEDRWHRVNRQKNRPLMRTMDLAAR